MCICIYQEKIWIHRNERVINNLVLHSPHAIGFPSHVSLKRLKLQLLNVKHINIEQKIVTKAAETWHSWIVLKHVVLQKRSFILRNLIKEKKKTPIMSRFNEWSLTIKYATECIVRLDSVLRVIYWIETDKRFGSQIITRRTDPVWLPKINCVSKRPTTRENRKEDPQTK